MEVIKEGEYGQCTLYTYVNRTMKKDTIFSWKLANIPCPPLLSPRI
jgi:hypothetical protein